MSRRVVVTGLGAVTPLGHTIEETWAGIVAGKSGIGVLTRFSSEGFNSRIAGEVRGFSGDAWMNPREAALADPFLHYAAAGAAMAIDDSEILAAGSDRSRIGVSIGTATGGLNVAVAQQQILDSKGPRFVSPMTVPFVICDMASGLVSIQHKLEGPNHCIVSACATGASAIGESMNMIQRGSVDAMIAGASDSISQVAAAGFASARALSTHNDEPEKASRPFDKGRNGFVLAEGSAVVVLEELEHAKARGARIYGELVGYGSCADAHHLTAPDPTGKGAVKAMREAIAIAQIEPSQIGYVNAHATSTPMGDKIECAAMRQVFGAHLDSLPASSTKSMTGHMLGSAGSIEAIFCLLAIRDDILPPTINQMDPDPECVIDSIPNQARKASVDYALSNSFGFGGHNVSLLFKRWLG